MKLGRPTKMIEYPLKKCGDCHINLSLNEFICSRYTFDTVCKIYWSSFCRSCGYLRHSKPKRSWEQVTKARQKYRHKQKQRNGCMTCGVKLDIKPLQLCIRCYVLTWEYKNKYYIQKKYNKVQIVNAPLHELLSLPGSEHYPKYKLVHKIPPSIEIKTVLTTNDFIWTQHRPKRKMNNYDPKTWAQRFKKKELVYA